MARSEIKSDWLGNKYIQHYDDNGNEIGRSEEKTDWAGDKYIQHYDNNGTETGRSEYKTDWLGNQYTQHYDINRSKTGYSEDKKDWLGNEYTQHYDNEENEIGRTENKKDWLGNKYKETVGNSSWTPVDLSRIDDKYVINLLIKVVAYLAVGAAILYAVFWIVSMVVILSLINIATIALIVGLTKKQWSKFLLPISIIGAILIVLDFNYGWSTKNLINGASLLLSLMPFFYYLNIAAGLVAAYFLIRNFLNDKTPPAEDEGEFSKRNLIVMSCLFLVGSLTVGLQKYFEIQSPNQVHSIPTSPPSSPSPDNNIRITEKDNSFSVPIDNLFKAWTELNLQLYMQQWDFNAAQYSKKFNTRSYQDILKRRQSLFSRLSSVKVINYEISDLKIESNGLATLNVRYSMDFHFKDGKKISEKDIVEKYVLKFAENEKRWLILKNFDYFD